MKEVLVMNRIEARLYSREPHSSTSIIISINDVNAKANIIYPNHRFNNNILAVLHVFFDDIEEGPNAIKICDANAIVDFVNYWQDKIDTIIIHCNAGVSRSAGCAAAILKYFTGSGIQIFGNNSYNPNIKVFKTILKEFYRKS